MPRLIAGQTVRQTSPFLRVTNRLSVGRHRFGLQVVDTADRLSKPTELVITVKPEARTERLTSRVTRPRIVAQRQLLNPKSSLKRRRRQ